MKRHGRAVGTLVAACLVALGGPFGPRGLQAQPGYDLFQQALVKERSNGEIREAIALYERIVGEYGEDRSLAARALVQLGRAYETLGSVMARSTYQRVLTDYPDQSGPLADARARIEALDRGAQESEAAGDATVARLVWSGPTVDATANPSPDGRYLFGVDWATGDLMRREVTTGQSRLLTHERPLHAYGGYPQFALPSPKGDVVVTNWLNEQNEYELRVVPVSGGAPRTLLSSPEIYWVAPHGFTPDGAVVLAHFGRTDGTNQIALVSVADGSTRVLKSLDWRQPTMSLSPDGRFVAYSFPPDEASPEEDVFLLATDGSREVRLVEHPSDDGAPVWAPDGSGVVFLSDRSGSMDAWFQAVEDGEPTGSPRLLRRNLGDASLRGITSDGVLVYSLSQRRSDVYTAALDAEQERIVAPPTLLEGRYGISNAEPAWSPDGTQLAYRSLRLGALVVRSLETGEERALVAPGLAGLRQPRWSPDGTRVMLRERDRQRRSSLLSLDPLTGRREVLLRFGSDSGFGQAEWEADGRGLIYVQVWGSLDSVRLVRHDLRSGEERVLYRTGSRIRDLALSPDGRAVAFRIPGEGSNAVMVAPLDGVEPSVVFMDAPLSREGVAWSKDGSALLIPRSEASGFDDAGLPQGRTMLWKVPLDGSTPSEVGLLASEGVVRSFVMHPDGERFAFTLDFASVAEMWTLEHFLPAEPGRSSGR